jgi:hypothetical protein
MRKVIVKAKDLISAIEEAILSYEDLYLVVNDDNYGSYEEEDFFYIWCPAPDRAVSGWSDTRPVAYDGLGKLEIKIDYEKVDLLLIVAKELIKIYGEEKALLVFYEIGDSFAIGFLNSTIKQEKKKINKSWFRELRD